MRKALLSASWTSSVWVVCCVVMVAGGGVWLYSGGSSIDGDSILIAQQPKALDRVGRDGWLWETEGSGGSCYVPSIICGIRRRCFVNRGESVKREGRVGGWVGGWVGGVGLQQEPCAVQRQKWNKWEEPRGKWTCKLYPSMQVSPLCIKGSISSWWSLKTAWAQCRRTCGSAPRGIHSRKSAVRTQEIQRGPGSGCSSPLSFFSPHLHTSSNLGTLGLLMSKSMCGCGCSIISSLMKRLGRTACCSDLFSSHTSEQLQRLAAGCPPQPKVTAR